MVQTGAHHFPTGTAATMAIRPEDVVVTGPEGSTPNAIPMCVRGLEFRGPLYRLTLRSFAATEEGLTLQADVSTETMQRLAIREGMDLTIHLPAERIRVYPN